MKWDYELEDPHLDARGFRAQTLLQDTDESAYYELDKKPSLKLRRDQKVIWLLSNGARFLTTIMPIQSIPRQSCTRLRELVAQDKAGEKDPGRVCPAS